MTKKISREGQALLDDVLAFKAGAPAKTRTPEMAVRLSSVLEGSAKSWLTLQESYDLCKARQTVNTKDLRRIDFNKVA